MIWRSKLWNISLLVAVIAFGSSGALAQGCGGGGSGGLPPCCSKTSMAAGGVCTAPAERYEFTIYRFGFEKNDGTVSDFGAARSFDAAAVSAGQDLGNFVAGAVLTPGQYIAVRPVISTMISAAVDVVTADGRMCRGSLSAVPPAPVGGNWPVCAAGLPDSTSPICRQGNQLKIRSTAPGAMTVGEDSSLVINFSFGVNNAILCHFVSGTSSASSVTLNPLAFDMSKY